MVSSDNRNVSVSDGGNRRILQHHMLISPSICRANNARNANGNNRNSGGITAFNNGSSNRLYRANNGVAATWLNDNSIDMKACPVMFVFGGENDDGSRYDVNRRRRKR